MDSKLLRYIIRGVIGVMGLLILFSFLTNSKKVEEIDFQPQDVSLEEFKDLIIKEKEVIKSSKRGIKTGENTIAGLEIKKTYDVPKGFTVENKTFGAEYSMMGYQCIGYASWGDMEYLMKNVDQLKTRGWGSPQQHLRYLIAKNEGALYDEDGNVKVRGHYGVATTQWMGIEEDKGRIGDLFLVELKRIKDGKTEMKELPIIRVDFKSYGDSTSSRWGHQFGACVLEFVVNCGDTWAFSIYGPKGNGDYTREFKFTIISKNLETDRGKYPHYLSFKKGRETSSDIMQESRFVPLTDSDPEWAKMKKRDADGFVPIYRQLKNEGWIVDKMHYQGNVAEVLPEYKELYP